MPVLIFLLLAVCLPQMLDRDAGQERDRQLAMMRYVWSQTEEGDPVLDSLSGAGTFRPVFGRFLYYRPAMFIRDFYHAQNETVAEALADKRFGVIIDGPMLVDSPPLVKQRLRNNYAPSPVFPRILLPRGNRAAEGVEAFPADGEPGWGPWWDESTEVESRPATGAGNPENRG